MKKFLIFLLALFMLIGLFSPTVTANTSVSTFAALQAAIMAAPTDGTATTISLQSSFSATGGAISIVSGQNIILASVGWRQWFEQTNVNQRHFIVHSGGSLTLQDVSLRGAYTTTVVSGGVEVRGGKFTMEEGSQISGTRAGSGGGGAVLVNSSGTFNLDDGVITMSSTSWSGGAVLIDGGNFTMSGSSMITRNSGTATGGGVEIRNGGIFDMYGGTISNNTIPTGTANTGGGVEVRVGSYFTMHDGLITDNVAAYGGGVHVSADSRFTMYKGTISYNTAAFNGGGIFSSANSYANNLPENAFSNLLHIGDEVRFFGNIAKNGARRPPTNFLGSAPAYVPSRILTDASSIFDHPINNFDINYQPPTGIDLITHFYLTFDAGAHGSFDSGVSTVEVPVSITNNPRLPSSVPAVTEIGTYSFIGWLPADAVAGMSPLSSMTVLSTLVNDDTTYVAQYLPHVTVSFSTNGGTWDDLSTVILEVPDQPVVGTYHHAFQTAQLPIRDDFYFRGWFTEPDGSGQQVIASNRLVQQTDHMLFAHWTEAPVAIIFFNVNGGIYEGGGTNHRVRVIADGTYPYASAMSAIPSFSKEFYTFAGWFTDPVEGVLVEVGEFIPYIPESLSTGERHLTLYAQWTHIPSIIVTFDAQGGTPTTQTAEVLPGEPYADAFAAAPTLSGYTFQGWFTDAVGGTRVFPSTIVDQQNSHMLFARWEQDMPPDMPDPPDTSDPPDLPAPPGTPGPSMPGLPSTPGPTTSTPGTSDTVGVSTLPDFREDLTITDIHFAYLVGMGDDRINPTGQLTRAETATVLLRIISPESRALFWTPENPFPDVPDNGGAWFSNAVSFAQNADLMTGMPDGTFQPDRSITRAEAITVLTRKLAESTTLDGTADLFPDIAGHWAQEAINLAGELGWVQGDHDGRFNPDANITRAEFATIINRLLQRTTDDIDTTRMRTWVDNANPAAWFYWDKQIASHSAPAAPARNWAALQLPDASPEDVFIS